MTNLKIKLHVDRFPPKDDTGDYTLSIAVRYVYNGALESKNEELDKYFDFDTEGELEDIVMTLESITISSDIGNSCKISEKLFGGPVEEKLKDIIKNPRFIDTTGEMLLNRKKLFFQIDNIFSTIDSVYFSLYIYF